VPKRGWDLSHPGRPSVFARWIGHGSGSMTQEERRSPTATATPSLRQRAVRGVAAVAIARLTAQVFQWPVTLLVARLLLPDDYGMMTAGSLFLGLADLLAEMGVGRALVQKQELTEEDLGQGFTLSLLLSALFYGGIFWLAVPAADFFQRPEFTTFLRVLALEL